MNNHTRIREKKMWIDLDNSPHVLFFKPIIDELNNLGYSTILTAREGFQVCQLAEMMHLPYKKIGKHYGRNRILKLGGLFYRALQLMPAILRDRPLLALSHGSRSQMLVAAITSIPSVVFDDYEHSKYLPCTNPTWMLVPEVMRDHVRLKPSQGIRSYPGIKEDVYVPAFEPDPNILRDLGIQRGQLVVTVRPPATEAHYHDRRSESLFAEVIELVGHTPSAHVVLLPRNEKQATIIKKRWPAWTMNGTLTIPGQVVDGLNLIWHSDLVISGGGTMNREAAALGVPVYSIFSGKIGAVDQYLIDSGRLILLKSLTDIHTKLALTPWLRPASPVHARTPALQKIVAELGRILETLQDTERNGRLDRESDV